uniref:Fumarate hydratase C-terminal domain-containing protein n=1 Tax=Bosea sp. NBC_00436 TaxID=2969620 RepID=A0A9E7ZKA0_9HYPH
MPALRSLRLPLSEDDVRSLEVGDFVLLSGDIVITAGLPTHHRIIEAIEGRRDLPFDLTGAAFFHLGSYSRDTAQGLEILYMNPTTSTRFNPLMPTLIRHFGLRMVGGKGGLDAACAEAMKEVGCVYLSFLGGGAPLHSAAIETLVDVGWNDLVSHYRLVKLRVKDLGPLTVAIDAHGNSVFDRLQDEARARLPEIVAEMNNARGATDRPR